MSDLKHTRGPWTATTLGNVMAGGTYIAHTDVGNDKTNAANARLIAAAPDLLRAIERLLDSEDCDLDQIKEAKAAISKATGANDA